MTRIAADSPSLTLHIPVTFRRRGGRKLVLAPDGAAAPVAAPPERNDTMIRLLVKAHRWRRRIETGQAKSITDLAGQEQVTDAYVQRLLLLTCLAPDVTGAILDGRQPPGISANQMLQNIPVSWAEQRRLWEFPPVE